MSKKRETLELLIDITHFTPANEAKEDLYALYQILYLHAGTELTKMAADAGVPVKFVLPQMPTDMRDLVHSMILGWKESYKFDNYLTTWNSIVVFHAAIAMERLASKKSELSWKEFFQEYANSLDESIRHDICFLSEELKHLSKNEFHAGCRRGFLIPYDNEPSKFYFGLSDIVKKHIFSNPYSYVLIRMEYEHEE